MQFTRAFLAEPARTGSIVPSSRFLIDRMLNRVDFSRARVFVELGPGQGCLTKEVLRRMASDASLIAIDTNPEFVRILRASFSDRRLQVVCGSALQLDHVLESAGFKAADCVISGLPFANMTAGLRHAILRKTKAALQPRGAFVLFQYRRVLLGALHETFGAVHQEYELLNFPPAHVFSCTR